jgi:hypothetical protein
MQIESPGCTTVFPGFALEFGFGEEGSPESGRMAHQKMARPGWFLSENFQKCILKDLL